MNKDMNLELGENILDYSSRLDLITLIFKSGVSSSAVVRNSIFSTLLLLLKMKEERSRNVGDL